MSLLHLLALCETVSHNMKKILVIITVLISSTLYCQTDNEWTLKEIDKSIDDKIEFIEHLVIVKNYKDSTTDYYRKLNTSLFANNEQAVYIYPNSIKFFFREVNSENYDNIVKEIKKNGSKISFNELEIRGEKLWVLTFKINSKYYFICKDSINNRYIEISTKRELK